MVYKAINLVQGVPDFPTRPPVKKFARFRINQHLLLANNASMPCRVDWRVHD